MPPEVIRCCLCSWTLDAEPPDVAAGTLASVFGYGVMSHIAYNQHLQKIERELDAHLSSHSLVEWVRKVSEQQTELDRLKADAALGRVKPVDGG